MIQVIFTFQIIIDIEFLKYTLSAGSYTQSVVAGDSGGSSGSALNRLNYPTGIHVDGSNIYIADTNNHRVLKWPEGASQGVVVAGGNNNGTALNQLSSPRGVTVDSLENVYVADSDGNRIIKWAPNSNQGVDMFGYFQQPRGIKLDSKDNFYVSYYYNQTVEKFQPQLDGTYLRISLSSDFNNGSLNRPAGIYIDKFDNVYVADRSNHRIEKLQQSPEIVIVAGSTTGAINI